MRLGIATALLVLASCTPGVEAPAPVTTTTTIAVTTTTTTIPDLADPEVARRLGAAPPEQIDWRRTVAGVTVVGIGTRPDPEELLLIEAAMAEMPPELDRVVTPRTIVRVPDVDDGHEEAAAYARGPDVYFLDRTFLVSPGGSSRMDVARAYAHELAHVAQYLTLEPDYLRAALEGRVPVVELSAGSSLVREFAAATGWVDRSEDPLSADWHLPDQVQASTEYARTGPEEDMAEAVAMVVMGRGEWIGAERAGWVEGWLGAPADRLGAGKPWAPEGSREVLSDDPLFDEDRVGGLEFDRVEPLYFALPEAGEPHPDLAARITERLRGRGLEGELERSGDPRLPRWMGLFTRADGVAFWVELWDFREQTGFSRAPEHPVLTYVVLW